MTDNDSPKLHDAGYGVGWVISGGLDTYEEEDPHYGHKVMRTSCWQRVRCHSCGVDFYRLEPHDAANCTKKPVDDTE